MTHTKGPWKCKFTKHSDWQIRGADGYSIVGIPHCDVYGRTHEDKVNARLITAAPELLKLLKIMVYDVGVIETKDIEKANKLIMKIEGRKDEKAIHRRR